MLKTLLAGNYSGTLPHRIKGKLSEITIDKIDNIIDIYYKNIETGVNINTIIIDTKNKFIKFTSIYSLVIDAYLQFHIECEPDSKVQNGIDETYKRLSICSIDYDNLKDICTIDNSLKEYNVTFNYNIENDKLILSLKELNYNRRVGLYRIIYLFSTICHKLYESDTIDIFDIEDFESDDTYYSFKISYKTMKNIGEDSKVIIDEGRGLTHPYVYQQ